MAWQWHWEKVTPTKGTLQRWLVATLPLAPTPQGKRAELRLYLKQWDDTAANPRSWCIDEMKWCEKAPDRWDPWKPFNRVQVAQADWPHYFSTWVDGYLIVARLMSIAGVPGRPIDGQRSEDLAVAAFERAARGWSAVGLIANYRTVAGEGVVDFLVDKWEFGGHIIRLAENLSTVLHKRRSLRSVRVTCDVDFPLRLRFLNVHFPLDQHTARRLTVAIGVIARWRDPGNPHPLIPRAREADS